MELLDIKLESLEIKNSVDGLLDTNEENWRSGRWVWDYYPECNTVDLDTEAEMEDRWVAPIYIEKINEKIDE